MNVLNSVYTMLKLVQIRIYIVLKLIHIRTSNISRTGTYHYSERRSLYTGDDYFRCIIGVCRQSDSLSVRIIVLHRDMILL